jgi:prepilin-type processing-associated H-X9-DG protein
MSERARGIDPTYVKGGIADEPGILVSGGVDPSICEATVTNNTYTTGVVNWSGSRWQDGRGGFVAMTTILPPNAPSCTSDASNFAAPGIYTPSSQHPGGVVVLFCDNSVRLISDQVDSGDSTFVLPHNANIGTPLSFSVNKKNPYGVWGALGTRRGREVVDGY